jgi:hypothetical protein
MKKNFIISKIEEKMNLIFSQINLGEIEYKEELFKKLEKIYFEIDFKSSEFKTIIYKGPIPFYLSLEQVNKNTYETFCYCSIENYEKVKIFLNSIQKKQKNDNNNNTGN